MTQNQEPHIPRKKAPKGSKRNPFQEFFKFFKDPDNAAELEKRINNAAAFDPSGEGLNGKKRKAKDSDDEHDKEQKDPSSKAIAFRALQHHIDYSNQQEVFLAVLYLVKSLPKALQHPERFLTKVVLFKTLAMHLDAIEPMLKGVTGMALMSLHDRFVLKRKELSQVLQADSTEVKLKLDWTNTKLSDAALRLCGLDEELVDMFASKEERRHYKKQKTSEPGSSPAPATVGNSKKQQQGVSDGESENEAQASKSATQKPKGAATAIATAAPIQDKAKKDKKDKKEKKDKTSSGKDTELEQQEEEEEDKPNHIEASKTVTTSSTASGKDKDAIIEMLLDRMKALEDEVKDLRRRTFDQGDMIKELKWQHVTK